MDLFGNVIRSRTEKLENAMAVRRLPRAPDAGRDKPAHWVKPEAALPNERVRALYVAPDGETDAQRSNRLKAIAREKSAFRSRAKRDRSYLQSKKARALGMKTGWQEMVLTPYTGEG